MLLLPLLTLLASSTATAAPLWSVTVDALNVTHQLHPHAMGCHVDLGYAHQPRALYAQMVVGSSFDSAFPVDAADGSGWVDVSTAPAMAGAATRDHTQRFGYQTDGQGLGSQRLRHTGNAAGRVAVANRGLGNEGLVFHAGRYYEGRVFARNNLLSPARLTVSIEDWSRGVRVLAQTTLTVPAGAEWYQLNFTLTPNANTTCEGVVPHSAIANASGVTCPLNNTYRADVTMSDRSAHVCVVCGGQFVLALESAGDVNLDAVLLQPGAWGRFRGLPVNREAVEWLQAMGTTLLRVGGSFVSRPGTCPTANCTTPANYSLWKSWRGDPAKRLSSAATWGHDLIGGFGMFEALDLAAAMDIDAVITTYAQGVHPDAMAELVEYCWGNSSTTWGKMRIEEDRHPERFRLQYVELGNEEYNAGFVAQVAAMEAKAKAVGVPVKLQYLFPQKMGINSSDAAGAQALGLGDRLMVDTHPGGDDAPGVATFHDTMVSPNTGQRGW